MNFRLLLSFALMLLLAACGGTNEQATATVIPPTTASAADSNADSSANSNADASSGVAITGDVTKTISNRGQFMLTSDAGYELTFYEGLDYMVHFTLPADTAPGTYALTSAADMLEQPAVDVSIAREPGKLASKGAVDYGETVSGTITIDALGAAQGDPVRGQFEFTASGTDRMGTDPNAIQTITVTGTFDGQLLVDGAQ